MKSVGHYLKDYRLRRKLSLEDVSKKTKIRLDYLEAIEADKFEKLPSAAFVKGFIRNYAIAVALDPEKALAVFRRDFDQNDRGKVVPRGFSEPIQTGKGFWSPRTSSLALIGLVIVMISGYAIYQVFTLQSAPRLTLERPADQERFQTGDVPVSGSTSSEAQVLVNNQSVSVDIDGHFETSLNLSPGEHTIVVESQSLEGKSSQETVTIFVED